MNTGHTLQRQAGLSIAVLFLLGLFAPLVAADGGSFTTPVFAGAKVYFTDAAPTGEGAVLLDLMVPWSPAPEINVDWNAHWTGLMVTFPAELIPADIAPLEDAIQSVALCPFPWSDTNNDVCVPLNEVSTEPGALDYALSQEDDQTVKVILGNEENYLGLRLTLRLATMADPAPGGGELALSNLPAGHNPAISLEGFGMWDDSPTPATPPKAVAAFETVAASEIRVLFEEDVSALDAAAVPQVLTTDLVREYFARAVATDGTVLSRIVPDWTLSGTPCGQLVPTTDGVAEFDPTVVTLGLPTGCHIEAAFTGIANDGVTGDLTITAGAPDRIIVIVDEDGKEIDTLDGILGDTFDLFLNVYDADDNTVLGTGIATWHVEEECGTLDREIGTSVTLTLTSIPDDHCHVHAVLAEDHGIDDETGEITIALGDLELGFTDAPTTTDADTPAQFTAVVQNENGFDVQAAVAYELVGHGSIDANGLFDPTIVGTQTIMASATHPGTGAPMTESAAIGVTVGALAGVVFTEAPESVASDSSVVFAAESRDADGNARTDTITYSVYSGDGTIDSQSGEFTPATVGENVINATATDADGNTAAASTTIFVNGGAAADLVFVAPPTTTTADNPVTFAAEATDANGNPSSDGITYSLVGDTTGATIDGATGLFTPRGVGEVTVQAEAGSATATTVIEVTPGVTTTVTIAETFSEVKAGEPTRFSAGTTDQHGNPTADTVEWSTGSGDIDASGSFTGTTAGPASVTATVGEATDTAEFEIVAATTSKVVFDDAPLTAAAGEAVQFTAHAEDAYDNPTGDTITWAPAELIDANGIFTATDAGVYDVTASAGDAEATATIEVGSGATSVVVIHEHDASITADEALQFTASAEDEHGNPTGEDVVWSASSGSIDPETGLFTPATAESVTITAEASGVQEMTNVVVTPGVAVRVSFTTAPTEVGADGTATFEATAYDAKDNPTDDALEWSADSGAIDAGVYTPASTGTDTVHVMVVGTTISNSTEITVTAGSLDSFTVSCETCTTAGEAGTVTIVARDANGNALDNGPNALDGVLELTFSGAGPAATGETPTCDGVTDVTFSSGVAEVSCAFFLAESVAFTVTNATSGATGSATLDIDAAEVATVATLCDSPVTAGATAGCSATAYDAYENAVSTTISWAATAGGFSSSSGATTTFFPPTTADTYTVTATADAIPGAFDVEVVPGDPASIVFSLPYADSADVEAHLGAYTFTATVTDSFGNLVADGTAVAWSILATGGNAEAGSFSASDLTTTDGVATATLETGFTPGDSFRVEVTDDPTDPKLIRRSGTVAVVPGELHEVEVVCPLGCTAAGDAVNVELTAKDIHGNKLDAGANELDGAVSFVFGGAAAAPSGDEPACGGVGLGTAVDVTFTDGVGTVSCTFYAAETFDLSAATSGVTGTLAVTVEPAAADHLVFGASSSEEVIAGDCTAYTVVVQDLYNNSVSAGAVAVDLTGAGSGAFSTDDTCGDAIAGITVADGDSSATFYFGNNADEDVVLEAASIGLTGDTHSVSVFPSAPAGIVVGCVDCATAGINGTVTLDVQDIYGNTVGRGPHLYDGTKALTFSGPADSPFGEVPGCAGVDVGTEASVVFTDGTATIECALYAAETFDLSVTNATGLTGSLQVTIAPAAAASLVGTLPGETFEAATGTNTGDASVRTAGTGFQADLRFLDAFGNVADVDTAEELVFGGASDAYTGEKATADTIDFGTATSVTFTDGLATVDLVLYRKESATLTVANGTISTTLANVAVKAGTATGLGIFDCDPATDATRSCLLATPTVDKGRTTTAGAELVSLKVAKLDAYENVLEFPYITVAWSSADLAPELSGSSAGVDWVAEDFGNDGVDDSGSITVTHGIYGATTVSVTVQIPA